MAARNGLDRIDRILAHLLKREELLKLDEIKKLVEREEAPDIKNVHVDLPDLKLYDEACGLGEILC